MKKEKNMCIISVYNIKDTDAWANVAYALFYKKFKEKHMPRIKDESKITDLFYEEVIAKKFLYGEYANLELKIDEDLNIVGGKILLFEDIDNE